MHGFSSAKQGQPGLVYRREIPVSMMLGIHGSKAEAQSEYIGSQSTTESGAPEVRATEHGIP